jgi:hypothetical protein
MDTSKPPRWHKGLEVEDDPEASARAYNHRHQRGSGFLLALDSSTRTAGCRLKGVGKELHLERSICRAAKDVDGEASAMILPLLGVAPTSPPSEPLDLIGVELPPFIPLPPWPAG